MPRGKRPGLRQVRAVRLGELARMVLRERGPLPAAEILASIVEAFPNESVSTIGLGNILRRTPGINGRFTRNQNIWSEDGRPIQELPALTEARMAQVLE